MRNQTVIAYWLVPAEPARGIFRSMIRTLAREFDAPRFEPHVTLLVLPEDERVPARILRQIKAAPMRLRVRAVGFSSRFTKTLFVRLDSTRAFEKLSGDLRCITKSRARLPANPHVSLLYKTVPLSIKAELASSITLPFRDVVFDSIKVLRCPAQTRTGEDVRKWWVIVSKKLRA